MNAPTVIVVGLGPAGPEYVTQHTLQRSTASSTGSCARRSIRRRTLVPDRRHASTTSTSAADTFDDVYAEITDRLVAAAQAHGEILYAVPGSPLVLERTVRRSRATHGSSSVVLPAMSFLDIAYARLGIDPVEAGVTPHRRSRVRHRRRRRPRARCSWPTPTPTGCSATSSWPSSDASGDEPVVILQRLGAPDERRHAHHLGRARPHRRGRPPHVRLHPRLWPRRWAPSSCDSTSWPARCASSARGTRSRRTESLVQYLLEETYEVVDALEALDPDDPATDDALVEELGDLLYQIEFHATIAEQEGRFTMADVAQGVHDKLVRRHPHVFGDVVGRRRRHRASPTGTPSSAPRRRARRCSTACPRSQAVALVRLCGATQGGEGRASTGPTSTARCPKIAEEAAEVRGRPTAATPAPSTTSSATCCSPWSTWRATCGVEPEAALRAATHKFRARFERVEALATERGLDLHTAGLDALDALWDEVKNSE